MNLLLDTHTLLWALAGDRRLGRDAANRITDPANSIWVSAASAWELAIKVGLGRLQLRDPLEEFLPREIERCNFLALPIGITHALATRHLPPHHNDPFDRMLIAQAAIEGLTLVTADAAIRHYDVAILPADR